MGDDKPRVLVGGEAIGDLMRSYEAAFELSEDDWLILKSVASIFRSIRKRSRSRRKAAARSRRNSGTAKRHAHGRAQRTRRCKR